MLYNSIYKTKTQLLSNQFPSESNSQERTKIQVNSGIC